MLRNLKTADIFKMSKILKKMGLKVDTTFKEIDSTGKEITKDKSQQQVGAELILSVFENIHMAELEVNEFLADLAGMKAAEFAELPIEQTMEIMAEFKQIPGLASFFKTAGR
jgi:hypothetical protein